MESSIFQVLIGFVLLYVKLGVSALISGMLIVLMVPVQYYIGSRLARVQKKMMVTHLCLLYCNMTCASYILIRVYKQKQCGMFTSKYACYNKKGF